MALLRHGHLQGDLLNWTAPRDVQMRVRNQFIRRQQPVGLMRDWTPAAPFLLGRLLPERSETPPRPTDEEVLPHGAQADVANVDTFRPA